MSMATRGSYVHISMGEFSGASDNISFMQFSTKIDGFEQNYSQDFENSYNSYEQYPLDNFFIFTIYQNYTLALIILVLVSTKCSSVVSLNFPCRHTGFPVFPDINNCRQELAEGTHQSKFITVSCI